MNAKQILTFSVTFFLALLGTAAVGEATAQQHIQIAEIDVDGAQLEAYNVAVREQIEAAIRLEPGVFVLYSVSNKDNPAHVTVFEIYRDREAYLAHLQAPHFLKYKATVGKWSNLSSWFRWNRSCSEKRRSNKRQRFSSGGAAPPRPS